MKYIICIFFLIMADFSMAEGEESTTENPECKEMCSPDCLGIVNCINGNPMTIDCKTQTGDSPYCDKDTLECVKTLDNCDASTSDISCDVNMKGIFIPDLMNCQKYLFCNEDKTTIPYTCPSSTRYDPVSTGCTTSVYCYTFDFEKGQCKGHGNSMIVHPLDKSFYIVCDATTNKPILQYCDGRNYEFNPKKVKCEFVCNKEGRFKDDKDEKCEKYYECVRYGSSFIGRSVKCPDKYIFVDKNFDGKGVCKKDSAENKCEPVTPLKYPLISFL